MVAIVFACSVASLAGLEVLRELRQGDGGGLVLDGILVVGALTATIYGLQSAVGSRRQTARARQAMERAEAERLHAEASTSRQREIARLGMWALSQPDPADVTREACRLVAQTLDVPLTEILELEPDGRTLVRHGGQGFSGTSNLHAAAGSLTAYMLSTSSPVIIADLKRDRRFHPPARLIAEGAVSGILLQVPGRGLPHGLLCAYAKVSRPFDRDDVLFLQAVANVLAAVIDRERSDGQMQQTMLALRETDRERRRLYASVVGAQDDERRRISEGLHDDQIQVLTAVGMRLGLLRPHISGTDATAVLDELQTALVAAVERLRGLLFDLRPQTLDDEGLGPALALLCDKVRRASGLDVRLQLDIGTEPDDACRTVCYRLVQEALANVVKHAGATTCNVSVIHRDRAVIAAVRDDGCGFDPTTGMTVPGHIGLPASRERAELAGGWWRIDTSVGRGTVVEFSIPASEAACEPPWSVTTREGKVVAP